MQLTPKLWGTRRNRCSDKGEQRRGQRDEGAISGDIKHEVSPIFSTCYRISSSDHRPLCPLFLFSFTKTF